MIARSFLLFLLLSFAPPALLAQTPTTFTYQGRLYNNGALVNGSYVLRITPFDQPTGPTQLAPPLTTPALNVVDGIFSTTLDFGAGVFNGGPVWLAIEVQAPASGFVLLSPRQPVTPTPYAMNADKVGGLDATQLGNHDFADFYALMPPDNAATVAAGSDVQFPRDGASSGAIVRTSASEFALTAIGT